MRSTFTSFLFTGTLAFLTLLSPNAFAQSSCCATKTAAQASCVKADNNQASASCSTTSAASVSTSGCTPSSCRGAKTKFGEAKVITDLRLDLIALKADMEQSTDHVFEARSYDIHGIVGETDAQSLEILIAEVQIVEKAFVQTLEYDAPEFVLPDNNAKKVQYLSNRIEALRANF